MKKPPVARFCAFVALTSISAALVLCFVMVVVISSLFLNGKIGREELIVLNSHVDIGLLVVGAAFAAFSTWLGIRLFNRRERWAKRLAVALVLLIFVFYPISTGPTYWVTSRSSVHPWVATPVLKRLYYPLACTLSWAPPVCEAIDWWAGLFYCEEWTLE